MSNETSIMINMKGLSDKMVCVLAYVKGKSEEKSYIPKTYGLVTL
jgi:hypothetical protein